MHQSWLRRGAELSSQGQGLVQKVTTVWRCPFRRASVKESSVNPRGCGGLFLQYLLPGWIMEGVGLLMDLYFLSCDFSARLSRVTPSI